MPLKFHQLQFAAYATDHHPSSSPFG